MAERGDFRGPSERDGGELDTFEQGRVVPGRRTLTQTLGGPPGPGATPPPGKISLTHRIPSATAMPLPYRGEMESAFGHDFSGVEVSRTTREALGGAGGMAQGESVAFAGTPSKETVAHELAHVVQHREGLTHGETLADTGTSIYDRVADKMAASAAVFNAARARLPRPILIEVIGDRFEISYEVGPKNELVFVVRYAGPYEVAGDKVKERTLKIATPRADDHRARAATASSSSTSSCRARTARRRPGWRPANSRARKPRRCR
jgi:hypothetical protein